MEEASTPRRQLEKLIRIERHPHGPRVYLGGSVRVHHGSFALATLPICWRRSWMRAIALALLAHDIRDFPWRDRDNH